MAIPQKLLGGFFCQRLSVLIADINPLSIQDECTGSLFAFVIFFFRCTDQQRGNNFHPRSFKSFECQVLLTAYNYKEC